MIEVAAIDEVCYGKFGILEQVVELLNKMQILCKFGVETIIPIFTIICSDELIKALVHHAIIACPPPVHIVVLLLAQGAP